MRGHAILGEEYLLDILEITGILTAAPLSRCSGRKDTMSELAGTTGRSLDVLRA